MSGAEFILRKLLFGQRADAQGGAAHTAERGAGVPADDVLPSGRSRPSMASATLGLLPRGRSRPSMASATLGLLPRGVSGGEDFARHESESK